MTRSTGAVRNGLVLRFSVPASGEIAVVGREMAVKLADQFGIEGARLGAAVTDLVQQVDRAGAEDVTFEFQKLEAELKIEARQGSRVSETRIPITA